MNKQFVFGLNTMNESIKNGIDAGKRIALWKNLWYEKELTVLFGETNCGKSILAVQIAESIALNGHKVVYFDYEMINSQVADRYASDDYTYAYEFSPNFIRPDLSYDCECDFATRRLRLFKRIEEATERGIKIFIIDNISCLHSKLSDGEQACQFIQNFRAMMNRLDISVLLLGHSPKKGKSLGITIDNLAGSKQIANFIDACFCIGIIPGERQKVYIKQLKARTGHITMDENNVLVCNIEKQDNQFIILAEQEFACEKRLLKGTPDITPQKQKALQLFKEGKSYREIGRIIGCSDKTAKKWVMEMLERNKDDEGLDNNKDVNEDNEMQLDS